MDIVLHVFQWIVISLDAYFRMLVINMIAVIIKFEQHPLYRNLDLKGFEKKDDLVYRRGNFFEYEIPTFKIGN
jgi:hypothetical protein